MRARNNQKQLWSDKEFIQKLEQIKAKRILLGNPVSNLGDLTKEIIKCPSFENIEKELLKDDKEVTRMSIKLDGRFK